MKKGMGQYVYRTKQMTESPVSLVAHMAKESVCNAEDPCSISGLVESPGVGNGYPFQYSFFFFTPVFLMENPMDRGTWPQSMGSQKVRHN